MKDCTDCKFEKGGMICKQGHVRRLKYENLQTVGHFPLEECHAWEEKKKECWWCRDWEAFGKIFSGYNYNLVKKLIGLNPDEPKCPICGKKLEYRGCL